MQQPNQNAAFNTRTGLSKVAQYKWPGIIDAPGTLRWIHKHALQVDDSYQRRANENKTIAIARAWSWPACGVILVAERADSAEFFVFDGQHRVLAAMKRIDIEQLPCIVFRMQETKHEASAFLVANTNRKPMSAAEKFKALLMSQDPAALLVDELVRDSGRSTADNSTANSIRCFSVLLRHAEKSPDRLRRVWPVVLAVSSGHRLHERIVDGLMYIESAMPAGASLADKQWATRAAEVGYQKLLDAAQRVAAAYSKGGARIWAMGMVEALNHGRRNRLTLPKLEEAAGA